MMNEFVSRAIEDIEIRELFGILTGAVAPRPIAMASTISKDGSVNLSPFSFFNCFGANPATLVFSPSRRVRDNTTKHTLDNVIEHPEVVVNICNYSMVEQVSLSSGEYAGGVNEFIKSGLTPISSNIIKPPRIAEAPVSFECKVKDVIALGDQRGAGNLVISEIVYVHISKDVLNSSGKIDPFKLDPISRLGGNWYGRITADSLFEVDKPLGKPGIGFDALPKEVLQSEILSANDLAKLASVSELPAITEGIESENNIEQKHTQAKACLLSGDVDQAWKILLA